MPTNDLFQSHLYKSKKKKKRFTQASILFMTLGLKENESLEGEGLGVILGWDVETLDKVGFGSLYLIQFSLLFRSRAKALFLIH